MEITDNYGSLISLQISRILGEITLSDTADVAWPGACVWCTVDMTLKVVLERDETNDGTTLNFVAGPNPVRIKRIYSTGSTVNSGKVYGCI